MHISLSIRSKIWVSFGILVALLVAVGLITLANLTNNERKLVELVTEVQPAVVQSLNVIDNLDRASASLGFYLLSKEDIHKSDYLLYLQKISASVLTLRTMPIVARNPDTKRKLDSIDVKIKKLESYKAQMLALAKDDAKNIPAMKFAAQEVNPRVQIMLQSLQEILLAEESEAANPQRKQFLIEVTGLRHMLLSAVNELCLYMAFRQPLQITNFNNMRDNVDQAVKGLSKYDDKFLSLEQAMAMETLVKNYKEYFQNAEKLMKIHGAEDWRQDAYIIRKEIAPLLISVQAELNKMVETQQHTSLEESQTLTQQVNRTQLIVGGLISLGLLSAIVIGFILSRTISNPISSLKSSAMELARGNLDQEIDTRRDDELGSLARSFAEMRDAIRKKINDLHILNHTGEDLAGIHSQVKALQTALSVMREQTNVEWGSVYLLNEETQQLEIRAYHPERSDLTEHRAKSFKLGEGIAGRTAQEKRVLFIPNSETETDYVDGYAKDGAARAIICVPMIDEGKIFGVMNFSGEVGKVKFDASDSEFAETIARMTVVASKNIHMLNVIEDQNRNLEQKVLARTAELRQKTNDINNMLQNMHQGIFTINVGNQVHPEYSAYLENILETTSIAGSDAMTLLFSNSDLSTNSLDQINAALSAIVGEDAIGYDFNKHLLVKEFRKNMADGRTKTLELDWDPMAGDGSTIEKMMVTVRDVTELRALQAAAEHQKWELEVIGQILGISRNKFDAFVKNALQFIQENEALIKGNAKTKSEVIATLFRNMHTIKGNARTYGFKHITDVVHEVENTYDKLRKGTDVSWDSERLLRELYQAKQAVETYNNICKSKLAGADTNGVFVDNDLMAMAMQTLETVDSRDEASLRQALGRVRKLLAAIGTESISVMLDGIVRSIPDLAKTLGKEPPKVVVKNDHIRLAPEVAQVLKNVFTHEFRNSVDHGLEPIQEREAAGKPRAGTITLEAHEDKDKLVFKLYDDGRGLPLDKILKRALEKGLVPANNSLTDEQIANLVFLPGLSTSENLSDISGRGVGMDAVKKFVTELGGDIELKLSGKPSGHSRYRQFESRITLPAGVYVKVA
jgi:HAMP domain-containing protein/HPt (histidine-containing phosphotransfer) domain-containing protein/two-component sensor histidine kinase